MFRITMFPATNGDCLWIEYGHGEKVNRILIDGGVGDTSACLTEKMGKLKQAEREFELLVVTHIDNDHILGILRLLQDPPDGLKFEDIWFNGWKHLPTDPGIMGPAEAEDFTRIINESHLPWNEAFDTRRIAIDPDMGNLLAVTLPGGMRMTVMGPTLERLAQLIPKWEEVVGTHGETVSEEPEDADIGILGTPTIDVEADAKRIFRSDESPSNASSIVLLAEFDGKRCLFAGDSFSCDVLAAMKMLGSDPFELDALKVSHHGSRGNTDNEFLDNLVCKNYLISTNGFQHKHPSKEAISRIIVHGRNAGEPVLHFNYSSKYSEIWNDSALMNSGQYGYRTVYPERDGYLEVDL